MIKDHRAPLNANHYKGCGGRARVVPTYHYLLTCDEDEEMGYVEPAETRAFVPFVLPLM